VGKLRMLTRKEIAEKYDVDVSWVERATRSGRLPFTRYGTQTVLIDPKDFEAYVAACQVGATRGPLAAKPRESL
jgi:excisionase family DNA binding protein